MPQPPTPTPRPATAPRRRRPARPAPSLDLRDVVGTAHVAVGAMGVGTALFGLVMTAEYAAPGERLALAGLLASALAMAAAGLWLRDGQRRGALLAAVLDTARLVLVLLLPGGRALDVGLAVLLLAGLVRVWPTLGQGGAPSAGAA